MKNVVTLFCIVCLSSYAQVSTGKSIEFKNILDAAIVQVGDSSLVLASLEIRNKKKGDWILRKLDSELNVQYSSKPIKESNQLKWLIPSVFNDWLLACYLNSQENGLTIYKFDSFMNELGHISVKVPLSLGINVKVIYLNPKTLVICGTSSNGFSFRPFGYFIDIETGNKTEVMNNFDSFSTIKYFKEDKCLVILGQYKTNGEMRTVIQKYNGSGQPLGGEIDFKLRSKDEIVESASIKRINSNKYFIAGTYQNSKKDACPSGYFFANLSEDKVTFTNVITTDSILTLQEIASNREVTKRANAGENNLRKAYESHLIYDLHIINGKLIFCSELWVGKDEKVLQEKPAGAFNTQPGGSRTTVENEIKWACRNSDVLFLDTTGAILKARSVKSFAYEKKDYSRIFTEKLFGDTLLLYKIDGDDLSWHAIFDFKTRNRSCSIKVPLTPNGKPAQKYVKSWYGSNMVSVGLYFVLNNKGISLFNDYNRFEESTLVLRKLTLSGVGLEK